MGYHLRSPDYTKKIAILGDAMVGKTSLQSRYLGLGFKQSYTPTLGVNFSAKDFVQGEVLTRVLIWDMAGQPMFKDLRRKYFAGVDGCLLVFDVTRPFDPEQQILPWVNEVLEHSYQVGMPLAIIANKIDLDLIRQIPFYEGVNAATEASSAINAKYPVEYFETSAKEGTGVNDAFNWLIAQIMEGIISSRN
jgi:small GTP-binding protein